MLHRGKYAIDEPQSAKADKPVHRLATLIGMGREFNLRDKIVYVITTCWTFAWVLLFLVVTIYSITVGVKTESWVKFWRVYIFLMLSVSTITTIWFTIGGIWDIKKMFSLLGKIKRNDLDDGMVTDHHNVGEEPIDSNLESMPTYP